MHKRIQELAEQASHQSPDEYPVTIPYSKDFADKFAELIVKECLDIVWEYGDTQVGHGIAYQIAKHFGVEE